MHSYSLGMPRRTFACHPGSTPSDRQEDFAMGTIPDSYQDLLEKKCFANLATINADGTPQVTPVWFEYDGSHVVFNTAVGRLKDRNLRRQPQVALAIMDT